jgi:hypothetical protein
MPAELFRQYTASLKKGEVFKAIIKSLSKTGNAYWMDVTAVAVRGERGEILKYVSAGYPINDATLAIQLFNRQAEKMKLPKIQALTEVFSN